MSSKEVFQPSIINIVLKGLMVMFTKKKDELLIGLLREAPLHNLKIEAQKKKKGDPQFTTIKIFQDATAEGAFNLTVWNTLKDGIRKRDEATPIDRFQDPDSQSFNWLIDFEKDFFPSAIGALKDGFSSFLTLNNGEIFTRKVSTNHLQFQRPRSDDWIHFGRVAVEMGVAIPLDKPESRASFTKEGETRPIFETEPETDYQIILDRDDSQHPTGNDVQLYFLATHVPQNDRISFRSFPPLRPLPMGQPPSTPDAACPVNQQSQSIPI